MATPAFFIDEDVYAAVTQGLVANGIDAFSTPDANRLGETDESQLHWATSQDRAIVTFNVGDFVALHAEWLRAGKHHAGIIVSSQRSIGDTLRRLMNLARSVDSSGMRDQLFFLSDW